MRRRINAFLTTLIGMALCVWAVAALALMSKVANADIVYGELCNVNVPTPYRCGYPRGNSCTGCQNYGVIGICTSAIPTDSCNNDGSALCPGTFPLGCTCEPDAC
jgi:hypothetical protein